MTLVNKYKYPIIVFVLFGALVYGLLSQAPVPKKIVMAQEITTIPFMAASLQTRSIPLISHGQVTAADIRYVTSDTSGLVTRVSPRFVRGGLITEGETLVELERQPLLLDVAIKQAELDSVSLTLLETQAKARVAKRGAGKNSSPYARYIPQLKSAKSRVEAARAAVDYAKLRLSNAVIRAPMDGKIIEVNVSAGQHIQASQQLSTVYGVARGEVRLPLNDDQVQLLTLQDTRPGEFVGPPHFPRVSITTGQSGSAVWHGHITRLEGERDNNQLVYVIAEVPLQSQSQILLPGSFVEAVIQSPPLKGVVVMPRAVMRPGNKVWKITKNNKALKHSVGILYKDKDSVYIHAGIKQGDKIVASVFHKLVEGLVIHPVSTDTTPALLAGENL